MRINWLAIVVSALVFFVFGALWYGVVFKSAWLAAVGATPQTMPASGAGAYPFIVTLVTAFFLAYGLARVLAWRGELNPLRAAFIGFSIGLLIFGTMTWMDYAFEGRGVTLGLINIGFVALGMAIQGAILGAWRGERTANMTATVI